MSQDRLLERPKRSIKKPDRFLTSSSSDDGPPPQKKSSAASATAVSHMVNEDIDDIRRTLEKDEDEISSFHIDTRTHFDTQNTQSYTNAQIHTKHPSFSHYTPHTQTHILQTPYIQTHINTHPTPTPIPTPTPFTQQPTQSQNILLSAEGGKVLYTNTTLSQSHVPGTFPLQKNKGHQRELHIEQGDVHFRPHDIHNDNTDPRRVEERLHRMEQQLYRIEEHFQRLDADIRKRGEQAQTMEAEMKKITGVMQKILKCVQDRQTGIQKPDVLPVTNFQQMQEFEEATEEHYTDVVNYFHYIGGFNLKEAIRLCLKEVLDDSVATSYTWFGREEGRRPLFNTRLVKAIYNGVCKNNNFGKPQRSEFQRQMQESLRVMKERNRMRIRRRQKNSAGTNENLWDDEELDDIADTEANDNIQI